MWGCCDSSTAAAVVVVVSTVQQQVLVLKVCNIIINNRKDIEPEKPHDERNMTKPHAPTRLPPAATPHHHRHHLYYLIRLSALSYYASIEAKFPGIFQPDFVTLNINIISFPCPTLLFVLFGAAAQLTGIDSRKYLQLYQSYQYIHVTRQVL